MSIPGVHFGAYPTYGDCGFGYRPAGPRYHIEEMGDTTHFNLPQQPPSLLKRLFGGALTLGGILLGGLAFKRYCPGLAAQIGGLIPECLQTPFKMLGGNWLSRSLIQGAEGLLTQAEGIFTTLKGFLGGFFNKAG